MSKLIGYTKPIIRGPYKVVIRKRSDPYYFGAATCFRCHRVVKTGELWGYSNSLSQGFCMKCIDLSVEN